MIIYKYYLFVKHLKLYHFYDVESNQYCNASYHDNYTRFYCTASHLKYKNKQNL